MHLGQVQVKDVALPQHDKARVRFCINSGDGETHTIDFGTEKMLPRAVFGAVSDATVGDDFPHVIVALNDGTAAIDQAAGMAACSQASPPFLRPCATFSIGDNVLFEGAWKAVVQLSNCCNMMVKAPLAFICCMASLRLDVWVIVNISSVWLFFFPLIGLSMFLGVLFSIASIWICFSWVKGVCAAPSCPAKIVLLVVWAMVVWSYATFFVYVNGGMIMMLIIFLGLNLPIDLLLARCGVRPAAAMWPFYRMLGLQGCKVPALTLTVEPTDGGLDQV